MKREKVVQEAGAAMGKTRKSLKNMQRVTDTLSGMLVQEVQAAQARQGEEGTALKGMKEITAVLKDLAAVLKTLDEQGMDGETAASGVVLLPQVARQEEEP